MNTKKKKETKPKLTIEKAIKKFILGWDLKLPERTPVYYVWDTTRVPEWNYKKNRPTRAFILVDYKSNKREWHIQYVINKEWIYKGTIDDITGTTSISSTIQ